MARTRYVWRFGELYEADKAPPLPRGPRSALPCPAIRTDGMEPLQSMADGQTYDSKSAYYRSVKDAGCEIVGDDRKSFDAGFKDYEPDPVAPDIARAIEELGGA